MTAQGYHRTPHLAGDNLVFVTEDDIWTAPAAGGVARRLTTSAGECSLPRLSPDGSTIAFVGRDEGHPEVFVMPAAGGPPRRLTFLGADALYVCGWSADGSEILFTSDAGSPFVKETRPFTIPVGGGTARLLELGHAMTFAVDGTGRALIGRNAIDPARWKRYRGGTAGQLWADADGSGRFARIGREIAGNLVWPMWLGGRVFFLSDHEGVGNIYSCAPDGSGLRRHTDERDYYARFPSTDGRRIVYACGAEIVMLDPADGGVRRVALETPSNAPQCARRFVEAGDLLEGFEPSPDGTALGIVSRGRVFAMPLWEEAVTEYGADDSARRRHFSWLHDGTRIAYVDDSAGFERIAVEPADRSSPPAYLSLADVGRITELAASPVDDTLVFANHRHELLVVAPGNAPRVLDTSSGWRVTDLAFSPDGRYVAYAWAPGQDTSIIRIADLSDDTVHDATTALRTDRAPAWDPQGKYLYFISTRDFHPVYDALQFDLSFPQAMRPFVVTLRAGVPNPFVAKPAPLHRPKDDADDDDDGDKPEPLTIDFDGLPQRMLGFPVEEGHYEQIAGAKDRVVFSQFPVRGIQPHVRTSEEHDHGGTLIAYDFEQQRSTTLVSDIDDFRLGADARTLVYASRERLRVIDIGGDLPEEDDEAKVPSEFNRRSGYLDLGRISVLVEPRAEWRQMYAEAWRLQREQFWDEGMSGVDWDAVYERYAALLPRLRTRIELSDLIWEMQGELGTSHAYEIGGDFRIPPQYRRGFLGADYVWDEAAGGYRITRILRGDSWDRDLDSPLAEPGLDVRVGDVIVALGGRTVSREVSPDALLVNAAAREISLTLVRDGGERRRVFARTLRDERMLRYRAWVEENRRIVHERTAGTVGYVHIPDMGPWGFAEFHRGFLSEFNLAGLIVDVRYNRGGHISPLLLEKLARKRVGYDVSRYGPPVPYPPESVAGPIVALTNQFAGSDGDIFSHCFKLYGLGPLIGMRTWGGVIGINPYHRLVDGTLTTQPEYSFWFSDVGWNVENYGTDPDVEVDIAPHESTLAVDPQMERALETIMAGLRAAPEQPAFGPRPRLPLPARNAAQRWP